MSSKETHYNRDGQSANEGDGKEKSKGRTRKQLSPERVKDQAKKTHRQRGEQTGTRDEQSYRPKSNGDRPFEKRTDKPFERREERGGERKAFRPRTEDGGERKPYQQRGDKPFERREERGGERKQFRPRTEEGGERKPYQQRGDKPFERREERGGERKPFRPRTEDGGERKPYQQRSDKPFERREERGGERKTFRPRTEEGGERKPYQQRSDKPFERSEERGGERKTFERKDNQDRPFKKREDSGDRPARRPAEGGDRPFKKYVPFEDRKDKKTHPDNSTRKPYGQRDDKPYGKSGAKSAERPKITEEKPENPFEDEDFYEDERPFTRSRKWDEQAKAGPMTLNKYMAHSGVSSRREAAGIIKEGKVKVNGEVIKEPGYRVQDNDQITYDDKVMKIQKHLVYILLNKPKDFITTTDDEKGRRTVMDLVANAETDRIYPIGRLDRKTTGVLLMTNDGDLTQKLSHPSYKAKKIYQVTLTENLTKRDFDKIIAGVVLEDGLVTVDALAYLEKKNELGIEIHSGRNRIVRRLFESLGYVVDKLDRVVYAGLTKKNVSRGKWRFLTEKEVINLKHFKS